MTHESRCIEFPCTCVTILRDRITSLENKIREGLSCCCSGCSKCNKITQDIDILYSRRELSASDFAKSVPRDQYLPARKGFIEGTKWLLKEYGVK